MAGQEQIALMRFKAELGEARYHEGIFAEQLITSAGVLPDDPVNGRAPIMLYDSEFHKELQSGRRIRIPRIGRLNARIKHVGLPVKDQVADYNFTEIEITKHVYVSRFVERTAKEFDNIDYNAQLAKEAGKALKQELEQSLMVLPKLSPMKYFRPGMPFGFDDLLNIQRQFYEMKQQPNKDHLYVVVDPVCYQHLMAELALRNVLNHYGSHAEKQLVSDSLVIKPFNMTILRSANLIKSGGMVSAFVFNKRAFAMARGFNVEHVEQEDSRFLGRHYVDHHFYGVGLVDPYAVMEIQYPVGNFIDPSYLNAFTHNPCLVKAYEYLNECYK